MNGHPRTTLVLLAPLLLSLPALAQGFFMETPASAAAAGSTNPAVTIKNLTIKTRIVDGIATTELREVLHNNRRRPQEGTWLLPLPQGAVADGFEMTVNGQKMQSEVLDAHTARAVYEDIVRKQKDPALLEYMDNGCLRARVFPIPSFGDVTLKVRYRQALPQTAGLCHWGFPLRNARCQGEMAQEVVLDVHIFSKHPLKNIYAPFGDIDIVRSGEHEARVSLELSKGQVPQRDLHLFYGVSDQAFGLDLLSYRQPGEPGYFLMMLSPKRAWEDRKRIRKSITFVLDTSGSMEGQKIEQAQGAMKFFLGSLQEGDRFNVIPFATEAQPFFKHPVPMTADNVARAKARVHGIRAKGGTNIEHGLGIALEARAPAGMANMVVFLTDGLPTVGTRDTRLLLAGFRRKNTGNARIFPFGIGDYVNTELLDKLAAQSGGARDYVTEEESIEVKTAALFNKLSHPVLTDVRIECSGAELHQSVPTRTPDLFKGDRLLVFGRYKGNGSRRVVLRGKVQGRER
ncbi:MAG: VIT domain-containing protein, partial [Planctomycetota bacterium]